MSSEVLTSNTEVNQAPGSKTVTLELSVVMPCLNEAETLGTCIDKCQRIFREHRIAGEVIVADNGSTDGSQTISLQMGARLVHKQAFQEASQFFDLPNRAGVGSSETVQQTSLPTHSSHKESLAENQETHIVSRYAWRLSDTTETSLSISVPAR